MKFKIEYLILVILIIALSSYLYLYEGDRTQYELPQLAKISKKSISKVEITQKKDTIAVVKSDDKWVIDPQKYPVDPDKIKKILDEIEGLSISALVSESKAYNRYELDDEKKIGVKAFDSKGIVRSFELGKAASSYRHTFVKLPNDYRVYHARNNFRSTFNLDIPTLRDKNVLKFTKDEIQKVDITKGDKQLAMSFQSAPVKVDTTKNENSKDANTGQDKTTPAPKQVSKWVAADGKLIKENELTPVLTDLSSLRCSGFVNDKKKEDMKDPVYTIELTGTKDYWIKFYPKKNEVATDYPATSSENDYVFLVPMAQAEDMMKDPGQFVKE